MSSPSDGTVARFEGVSLVADEKKLLIPIDGSENSLRALSYVIKRAATDKRLHIYVLNVQPALPHSLFVTRAMIAGHHAAKSTEALMRVRRVLARTLIDAEVLVRVGDEAETIVKLARQKHCAEIVMGTRGLGSVKGLLLGSITTRVIHSARVPVTVVP
jgi:nucleotide-binding universal stress UspA family protein